MIAALPVIIGMQLALGFRSCWRQNLPRQVPHERLLPAPAR
jgi:hypothetical protein